MTLDKNDVVLNKVKKITIDSKMVASAICEYCNFDREPKEKRIELYKCTDTNGRYYALDIERPDGFIPEPWRNKPLIIQYCPICGRKLGDE